MDIHQLAYQMHVLSRAINFSNLSSAAMHVKLSQPQLSRIVANLESTLKLVLLDRDAKRKSAWTPQAMKLAEIYSKNAKQMAIDLSALTDQATPRHIRIGCLDGLIPLAIQLSKHLFGKGEMRVVELDMRDLSVIEEEFLRGRYDLIFTAREPSRKKFKYILELGYQTWETLGKSHDTVVLSTFDFNSLQHEESHDKKFFVSNSLSLRRVWVEEIGGTGRFPSEVRHKRNPTPGEDPVLLIAQDQLPIVVWETVKGHFRS